MIQPGLKDAILNKRMGNREVKTHAHNISIVESQGNFRKFRNQIVLKILSANMIKHVRHVRLHMMGC